MNNKKFFDVPTDIAETVVYPDPRSIDAVMTLIEAIDAEYADLVRAVNTEDNAEEVHGGVERIRSLQELVPFADMLDFDYDDAINRINDRIQNLIDKVLAINAKNLARVALADRDIVDTTNDKLDELEKIRKLLGSLQLLKDEVSKFWDEGGFKYEATLATVYSNDEVDEQSAEAMPSEQLDDMTLDAITSILEAHREVVGSTHLVTINSIMQRVDLSGQALSRLIIEESVARLNLHGIISIIEVNGNTYVKEFDEAKSQPESNGEIPEAEMTIEVDRGEVMRFIRELYELNATNNSLKQNFVNKSVKERFGKDTYDDVMQFLTESVLKKVVVHDKPRYKFRPKRA